MSSKRKWLLGCGIGCFSFVVLVAVMMGYAYFWVTKSEPVELTTKVLLPDAPSYFSMTVTKEDKATQVALLELLERVERGEGINVDDEFLSNQFNFNFSTRNATKDFEKMLPARIDVTLMSPNGGDVVFRVAQSAYANVVGLMFNWIHGSAKDQGNTVDHPRFNIISGDNTNNRFYFSVHERHIFISDQDQMLIQAMEHQETAEVSEVDARLADLNLARPVYGFIQLKDSPFSETFK